MQRRSKRQRERLCIVVCGAAIVGCSDPAAPRPGAGGTTADDASSEATSGSGDATTSTATSGSYDGGSDDSSDDTATTPPPAPHLVFSLGFQTQSGATGAQHVMLGSYTLAPDGSLAMKAQRFSSNSSHEPAETTFSHPTMQAPYGGGCMVGKIHVATPSDELEVEGTWTEREGQIDIELQGAKHTWLASTTEAPLWTMEEILGVDSGTPEVGSVVYGEVRGYGYLSPSLAPASRLSQEDLWPAGYHGEMWQVDGDIGSPWMMYGSGLGMLEFTLQGEAGVLARNWHCPYDGHPDVWCMTTLLLNIGPPGYDAYTNGGHDFNEDGCYNELGHAISMLGVPDDTGMVRYFLLVEHSWETDGTPILSVGRRWAAE